MNMTIGALAKRAKVNLQTLRYYEHRELLSPASRAASGYRVYNEDSLRRLKFIRHAQAFGFSLEEIKPLLELKVNSKGGCRQARLAAEAKVLQIGQRIEALQRIAKTLERLVAESRLQAGKGPCPILTRFYGAQGTLKRSESFSRPSPKWR